MGTHLQMLGRPMAEAAPEVVAQGFIHLFDTVYRTGEPFFAEGIPAKLDRQGDGTLEDVFFNLTFQPARDPRGQVEGVDIFGFDVTSQVRLRQREEELKRLAEERAALEQQFIGIVSHDLRNPLAAILLGTSALAQNPSLNERALKSVLRIASAAERANRMVKDLLDFTQARLGKGIPIHPRRLNLAEALEGWVEEARAVYPERNVNVQVRGDGHASVDPDRMAQVVGNLVSNALKYSPPDSQVQVRLREEAGALLLEVHNIGAPIPEAQHARLFQPLERGQGQRDMSSRSVGLGLFIVKHVVEAHGGSISVTSTPEAGTTFVVRLPR
jgi:phosphoserine phosphatase RsbU/P